MSNSVGFGKVPLKLFICHSASNKPQVRQLYEQLVADGFQPWLDERGIIPGLEWNPEIEKALVNAHMVILCLTPDFIQKASDPVEYIAGEIRTARKLLEEDPTKGGNFLLPVRLERCDIPPELELDKFQRVNLDREGGYDRLVEALRLKAKQLAYLQKFPQAETQLVGRQEEIAILREKLGQPGTETRLVTLTGPGGIGKTRLSLATASFLLPRFKDGIYLVDLTELEEEDAEQVIPAIARSVIPAEEADGQYDLAMLQSFLAGKETLIVLDNFEQVIAAHQNIAKLLKTINEVKLLITSREKLNIRGEFEYKVPLLSLDGLQKALERPAFDNKALKLIEDCAAVGLFTRRARQDNPDFRLTTENARPIAELCLMLEGLPLALEIAAARLNKLEPAEILDKMRVAANLNKVLGKGKRDLPDRHQSLQLSLDWSYSMLKTEQDLFGQLAIFNGGFNLKAVEAICENEDDPDLEKLDSLLDKSLVRSFTSGGSKRFFMLESIRQYAYEKLLEQNSVGPLKDRHARYYLQLVEKLEPQLSSSEQLAALHLLDEEYGNLRAAMSWMIEVEGEYQRQELALRLGGALWRYWLMRGYLAEGRRWLEVALKKASLINTSEFDRLALARAYKAAGTICGVSGDLAEARSYLENGLAVARQLDAPLLLLGIVNNLGNIAYQLGDYRAAEQFFLESLATAREGGFQNIIGQLLSNLGLTNRNLQNYEQASAYLEESIEFCRQSGEKRALAITLNTYGDVLLDTGNYKKAQTVFNESLACYRDLNDPMGLAQLFELMSDLAACEGNYERSARLEGAAYTLREKINAKASQIEIEIHERRIASARQQLGVELWQKSWETGSNLNLEEIIEFASEDG